MRARCPTLIATAVALLALHGVAGAQPAPRFTYSADGSEVTDARTGLVWRRCSEGQSWSGAACTGSAALLTLEQALARAQTQTGWRLPNVKELSSIADRGRWYPAIDPEAFPQTPVDFCWSSSPNVSIGYRAWGVLFHNGEVTIATRDYRSVVRLVRASQ